MYGVNTSIFTRPVDGSGRWRHIPGLLKHVTASGRNEIYGTNTADQIWRCKKPCVGDWKSTEEALMQCDRCRCRWTLQSKLRSCNISSCNRNINSSENTSLDFQAQDKFLSY